jgi:polysaccharide export outer membrane protein
MVITKVGQAWGRLGVLSSLLLGAVLFGGCQTNKADSGFSEVPGVVEAPAASPAPATDQGAAVTTAAANSASAAATNTEGSSEFIKRGDILLISFSDLPLPSALPPFDQKVRDDGSITLIYNHVFQAAGKRMGDLEREIRDFYVPSYFRNLTVTVRIAGDTRCFYLDGEVRVGGKIQYTGPITVSKAIASGGGFTDFANKRKVKLIRADGRTQIINCNDVLDHPERDPQVYPDDKIHVPRRFLW